MPELPEVETVVRDLRPMLCGQRIDRIQTGRARLRRPWQKRWEKLLVGRRFNAVRRRGKWIILDLDESGHILVHLGMTGQLTIASARSPRLNHTHVLMTLEGGDAQLRYRDVRRFGSVEFWPISQAIDDLLAEKLGPEPWELPSDWHQAISKSARCLKAILLDQRVVAGVGNIYADESLFEAGLSPEQLGVHTRPADAARLREAIICVLERAIAARGATIRDYVGGSGLQGGYQNEFQVYGRTGQPCPRCTRPIESLRLAGRSTHYCPACQPVRVRASGRK